MTTFSGDPYALLGVSRSAPYAEIKRAYRRLALAWHPDRNPGDPRAEERFKRLRAAFEWLSSAATRARTDADRERAAAARRDPFDGATWAESVRAAGGAPRPDADASAGPVGRDDDDAERADAGDDDDDDTAPWERAAAGRVPTLECDIALDVIAAVRGAEVRLTIDGTPLVVRIPPGAHDGVRARVPTSRVLRARGAATAVDLVLNIRVRSLSA